MIQPRPRRAFSLLEVMVSLAILTVSLLILLETQTAAVKATRESERILLATNLAQDKMAEVLLVVEEDGFTDQDKCEQGDFDDFGDDALDVELGDSLKRYHFEWCAFEIDLQLAGDIAGMAEGLAGSGALGGSPLPEGASGGGMPGGMDLSAFGLSPDMISEMLGRYIREVRVRVWWGEDSRTAEENGDEIVLVTHVINPTGAVMSTSQGDPGTE